MSLEALCEGLATDKHTLHSYLPVYEKIFGPRRDSVHRVLELGIYHGGSLHLWADYFHRATIYGLDIRHAKYIQDRSILTRDNVRVFTQVDGYNPAFVQKEFKDKDVRFDVLIDDGPHHLEHMTKFLDLYLPLLDSKGVLVVEDVKSMGWIPTLKQHVPPDLHSKVHVYDLTKTKGRFDDILFVVDLAS